MPRSAPPASAPAARPTDEAIHAAIYQAIVERRLAPGERLRETALGEIFGVSRTIVRQVLLRLSLDGVVTIEPNKGAAVALPSPAEARGVFEARRILETGIAGAVAPRADRRLIRALGERIAAEHGAMEQGDRRLAIRISGEFHRLIAEALGNAELLGFLSGLISRTSLILAVFEPRPVTVCRSDDHAELLRHFERGDGPGAAACMDRHLAAFEQQVDLRERGVEGGGLQAALGAAAASLRKAG